MSKRFDGHFKKSTEFGRNFKMRTVSLRNLETEIWDLKNGTHNAINPSLSVKYRVGLGLYIVLADFRNED